MMHPYDSETVHGLPSGLCSCKLGETEMHISALSPRSLWIQTPDGQLPCGAIRLYIYRPETGDYETHILSEYETGPAQHQNDAVLTRFCFDDPACAAALRRMLNSYARYLETKSTFGAAAYAAQISAYPEAEDDIFPESPEAWRRESFAVLDPLPPMPDECSLAVELNCPELWRLYISHPLPDFMMAYAACRNIPEGWLPARLPQRIYIGNVYCRHLFPGADELRAIAAKARTEGLEISIVTAELRSHSAELADLQIAFAREWNAELIANDWGMMERAAAQLKPGQIALGTMPNRRRKDPRIAYKVGIKDKKHLLTRNSLNDPGWTAFLKTMGIERFEFESCSLAMEIPEGNHSLHLPFYQTNTSLWCPLRALCLNGDRGMQADIPHCPRLCEENMLLYPSHLKMLGRWNSLLALDANISALSGGSHFDRWVLNF